MRAATVTGARKKVFWFKWSYTHRMQSRGHEGYGWPKANVGARGRCLTLRSSCGAPGTRYTSMRGLIGSRRVPPT
eukprot:5592057-Prymnesium_polylepis.1